MKKVVRNILSVSQTVILVISLAFTSCLYWQETEPIITIDPSFPLAVFIEGENELIENIAMIKAFSFDDPNLDENECDLILFGPSKYYRQENGMYILDIPNIVSDEKLKKLSGVIEDGKVSNQDAQVACLQYFRAYNTEGKYIGYFEWGCYSPDDGRWFNLQYWYADSDVAHTSNVEKLMLSLHKMWNIVLKADERYINMIYERYIDLEEKYKSENLNLPEWRFHKI